LPGAELNAAAETAQDVPRDGQADPRAPRLRPGGESRFENPLGFVKRDSRPTILDLDAYLVGAYPGGKESHGLVLRTRVRGIVEKVEKGTAEAGMAKDRARGWIDDDGDLPGGMFNFNLADSPGDDSAERLFGSAGVWVSIAGTPRRFFDEAPQSVQSIFGQVCQQLGVSHEPLGVVHAAWKLSGQAVNPAQFLSDIVGHT
jgi:hypothetical protein